jgi:hypothetical protein
MEQDIVKTIDISVKGHLQQYAASFETQLTTQLSSTCSFLDKKNEERSTNFRDEHRAYMQEFQACAAKQTEQCEAMKLMLESKFPSLMESEIIFAQDQHSQTTKQGQTDLSFDSDE